MSRILRRLKMKLLQKTSNTVQKSGFSTKDTVLETAALVNIFSAKLKPKKNDTSSKLTKLANAVLQKSLDKNLDYKLIECAEGCTFCCHSFVSAKAPEIFSMIAAINSMEEEKKSKIIKQIETQDKLTRDLNSNDKTKARIPCGLIVDGMCSAYETRPSACRWHHSLSKTACETSFGTPEAKVPVPNQINTLKARLGVAYLIALGDHNLANEDYELHHALMVALHDDSAETRWLNGEDVFADVQIDRDKQTINNPDFELRIEEIKRACEGDFNA